MWRILAQWQWTHCESHALLNRGTDFGSSNRVDIGGLAFFPGLLPLVASTGAKCRRSVDPAVSKCLWYASNTSFTGRSGGGLLIIPPRFLLLTSFPKRAYRCSRFYCANLIMAPSPLLRLLWLAVQHASTYHGYPGCYGDGPW